MSNKTILPAHGTSAEEIFNQLESFKINDLNWPSGKFFGYVFYPGEDIYKVAKDAYAAYFATNGLNPSAFPSLRKMETDVVSMSANLLNGNEDVTGVMTSGGTESIMMAVLSAREWAEKQHRTKGIPEVIVPATAHPAFAKACHFFGLKLVEAPVRDDFRADVDEMKKRINANTVLLVGSAPQFPQGVIDPIAEIAALAAERQLLCHVDACVGGFLLPFLEAGGVSLPLFDFRLPGVTSISADLHKYGYAAKGASVILYKNRALRKGQFYIKTNWTGGIYGSPSFAGTRPGGAIAAAWAVLNYVGMDRYVEMSMNAYHSAKAMQKGIAEIADLKVLGNPEATLFALGADKTDVHALADEMYHLGWYFNRQQTPDSLHVFVTDIHVGKEQMLLDDLQKAVAKANELNWPNMKKNVQVAAVKGLRKILPEKSFEKLADLAGGNGVGGSRKAAMYGMMGAFSGTGKLEDMVMDFIDQLNSPEDQVLKNKS
jgi:sphinganine-1-phosphate aldolase